MLYVTLVPSGVIVALSDPAPASADEAKPQASDPTTVSRRRLRIVFSSRLHGGRQQHAELRPPFPQKRVRGDSDPSTRVKGSRSRNRMESEKFPCATTAI